MPEEKQKSDVFYITHSGELLIWLIVILIIVALNTLFFIAKEKSNDNYYRVFLQDIDGLIVGSPVRMMGVEVGHVTKIKPVGNDIYVKFIITNKDVYVPQGTIVTVEFSGMAGSKSLELYLPDKDKYIDNSVPLLTENPPKRLRDSMALLGVMYKKLSSIIYTTSSFGKKLDLDIDSIIIPKGDLSQFLNYSNQYLDKVTDKVEGYRQCIKGISNNVR